jgi:hypothetical protein
MDDDVCKWRLRVGWAYCRSEECSKRFCKLLAVYEGTAVVQTAPLSPRSVPQLFARGDDRAAGGRGGSSGRPALRSTSSSTDITVESTLSVPPSPIHALPTLSPGTRFSPRPLLLPNAL